MGFSTMIEILKEKHKKTIVLVKTGVFYIAVKNDAVLLHNKLGLKCICYKKNECKIGIPINVINRYIEKLNKLNYSYIIYDFIKQEKKLKVIAQKNANPNNEENNTINCLLCKGIKEYEEDEYMEALKKLLENKDDEK